MLNTSFYMISFKTAITNFYLKTFKLEGRATRAEFWWAILYQCIAISVLAFAETAFSIHLDFIFIVYIIVNLIPNISLQVRRFHDIGKSGTTLASMITGWISCFIVSKMGFIFGLFGLGCLIIPIWHLILNLRKGVRSDNQYGNNPYAISLDCIDEQNEFGASNSIEANTNIEDVEL